MDVEQASNGAHGDDDRPLMDHKAFQRLLDAFYDAIMLTLWSCLLGQERRASLEHQALSTSHPYPHNPEGNLESKTWQLLAHSCPKRPRSPKAAELKASI